MNLEETEKVKPTKKKEKQKRLMAQKPRAESPSGEREGSAAPNAADRSCETVPEKHWFLRLTVGCSNMQVTSDLDQSSSSRGTA